MFWMSSWIDNYLTRLYCWDITFPGEMRTKVFTRSGHYFGCGITLKTSSMSALHFRLSTGWDEWNLNAIPIVRSAILINMAL